MDYRHQGGQCSSPPCEDASAVTAANANGGDDNITVVLFELVGGDPVAEPEVEPKTEGQPGLQTAAPAAAPAPGADGRTHGAGPGGRLAARAYIVIVVVVGALGLYWGITK